MVEYNYLTNMLCNAFPLVLWSLICVIYGFTLGTRQHLYRNNQTEGTHVNQRTGTDGHAGQ